MVPRGALPRRGQAPLGVTAGTAGRRDRCRWRQPGLRGMHDAAASVAGGSLRAIEAVLRGDEEHAFHPGGGLHHAMPDRASGFCIYDDPALAIARARRDGLRVLYLDFDVHHGDGVQAIHWDDPGVLTLSIHESGHYLFPGSGFLDELGEGAAAGTSVNVPMEPETGEGAVARCRADARPGARRGLRTRHHRQPARRRLARVGPARAPAHDDDGDGRGGPARRRRRASLRGWPLACDRRRRVRRLPGRAAPVEPGLAGRARTATSRRRSIRVARAMGGRRGRLRAGAAAEPLRGRRRMPALRSTWPRRRPTTRSRAVATAARALTVPLVLRVARDRGWWDPTNDSWCAGRRQRRVGPRPAGEATILPALDPATWDSLDLAARVIAPADAPAGHALVAARPRGRSLRCRGGRWVRGSSVSPSSSRRGRAAGAWRRARPPSLGPRLADC